MNLSQNLSDLWARLSSDAGFATVFILSVLMIALVYFLILKFLLANNSQKVVVIVVLINLAFGAILLYNERIDNGIFLVVQMVTVLSVICLYSVEIKRAIWKSPQYRHADAKHGEVFIDEEKIKNCISEIVKALQDMSKNDVGAIIVLSTGNIPSQILESGVKMDSEISSALIESVFFPKTPLHDGAMVLSGTRIVAAGCFLPLSQQMDKIPKELGSRHRAGLGVTENIDVVSLIVSEETGIITVAKAGKMTRYADANILVKTLTEYYWKELDSSKK